MYCARNSTSKIVITLVIASMKLWTRIVKFCGLAHDRITELTNSSIAALRLLFERAKKLDKKHFSNLGQVFRNSK